MARPVAPVRELVGPGQVGRPLVMAQRSMVRLRTQQRERTQQPPFVAPGADTVLEEGMTFSVEPGIYRAGRWGARLEDIVVVTADGRRDLNTGERGLRVL